MSERTEKSGRIYKLPDKVKGNPQFIMQDLGTGEITPADDLAQALFGPGVKSSEITLQEIEGKTGKEEEKKK